MNLEYCICIHVYTYVGWCLLWGIFSASEDLNPVPDKQASSRRGGVLWTASSMDAVFSISEYLWLCLSGLLFNRLKPHKSECRNKEGTLFLFGSSVTQNTFPGEKLNFISLNTCRILSMPYGINKGLPFPFLERSRWWKRELAGCTERGCTARGSKPGEGRETAFLL